MLCPSTEVLANYLSENLDQNTFLLIQEHLESCKGCLAILMQLSEEEVASTERVAGLPPGGLRLIMLTSMNQPSPDK